jgi:hypothetical protein
MQFSVGRSDIVRAINQRWLIKFWVRSLGNASYPHWSAVEAENMSRVAADLSFLEVARGNTAPRFRIFSHGTTIGKVYGGGDCRGKFLDEVMPPQVHVSAILPYRKAVESGRPVYTVQDLTDSSGRDVQLERLLLPFTNNGQSVDRILASFEFICADGGFDSHDLMNRQPAPPVLRLAVTIARELA